jgi:hypothetical protein
MIGRSLRTSLRVNATAIGIVDSLRTSMMVNPAATE